MYKINVEYMKVSDDEFGAILYCNECDLNSTTDLFKMPISDFEKTGLVGNEQFVDINYVVTKIKTSLDEVKQEVKKIINKLKIVIEQKRKTIIEKETFEI